MFPVFHQKPDSSVNTVPGTPAYRSYESAIHGHPKGAKQDDRRGMLRRATDVETVLRSEADQLFSWLTEALGDAAVDGPHFVAGVERLAEVLVQLRAETSASRRNPGMSAQNQD